MKAAEDVTDADLLQHHLIRAELKKDRVTLKFTRTISVQSRDPVSRENVEQAETMQITWHGKNGPASSQPDNADKLQQPDQATL